MWDFEHLPLQAELSARYSINWMLPSECADRLADGTADLGLVPIAALTANPALRVLPGCTIASKSRVRSLLLVRRATQPIEHIRTVAADTASRTTVAHARILFDAWGNHEARWLPMAADLDTMLDAADAAVVIGDPALLALEEQVNRFERTEEELVYHDVAEEWRRQTGLPFVSAVWAMAPRTSLEHQIAPEEAVTRDLIRSRDHGLSHIDGLVDEWSARMPVPPHVIRTYLTSNIHYILDEECIEGMRCFFRRAAEIGILPAYEPVVTALPF